MFLDAEPSLGSVGHSIKTWPTFPLKMLLLNRDFPLIYMKLYGVLFLWLDLTMLVKENGRENFLN